MKECRVCGKVYEACASAAKPGQVFRWQEVACSPECGAEYLRRVQEARTPVVEEKKPRRVKQSPVVEKAVVAPDAVPAAIEDEQDSI